MISFEKQLVALGYHIQSGTVDYPTALAIRNHIKVTEWKEVILSYDQSALVAKIHIEDDECVWIIGTHLNHMSGEQRNKKMKVLLNELNGNVNIVGNKEGEDERVILVGDMNQQRSQDYTPDEWQRICLGMIYRNSCQDDGVAKLLRNQGFQCSWDTTLPNYSCSTKKKKIIRTNWDTTHPPATHWSGTIVDYPYGYNVSPLTISISPVGWSDHRMTVCDWIWSEVCLDKD